MLGDERDRPAGGLQRRVQPQDLQGLQGVHRRRPGLPRFTAGVARREAGPTRPQPVGTLQRQEAGTPALALHPRPLGGDLLGRGIGEIAAAAGGVDPGSLRSVLTIAQPSTRHHGGNVVFGPDGLLWVGIGDDSPGGDPTNAAQSLGQLSGKLLRLDPRPSGGKGYTVPKTNPFVGQDGARPEIWAYGLRNTWRFRSTRPPGTCGSATSASTSSRRSTSSRCADPRGPTSAHQYGHSEGRCAVIGGHVHRGTQIPNLQGAYVYGDVCDVRIRALARGGGQAPRHRDLA